MAPLRIALTLPGAVALGAYQAGAVSALIEAVRAANAIGDCPIVIDVIASSSAGSLTGLLSARCLLEGLGPADILYDAWVVRASAKKLAGRGNQALLSLDTLHAAALELLDVDGRTATAAGQPGSVTLSVSVQILRGLAHDMPAVATHNYDTVSHLEFLDWTITGGMPLRDLCDPPDSTVLGAVLASAANQLAFPAQILTLPIGDAKYRSVRNLPRYGTFWCADAALLDREPIGRALAVARQLDTEADDVARRLHVVVEPQPRVAGLDLQWSNPGARPTWLQVLARTAAIAEAQTVYDDISGIEECNARLIRVDRLLDRLSPALEALPEGQRAQIEQSLGDQSGGSLGQKLRQAVARAAGVEGRQPLRVEVISPTVVVTTGARSANDKLAGETIFRFGGFLERRLRQSDFDLGYHSTLTWLRSESAPLGPTSHAAADLAARRYTPVEHIDGNWTPPTMSWRGRLQLIPLLWRIARVAGHDIRTGVTPAS